MNWLLLCGAITALMAVFGGLLKIGAMIVGLQRGLDSKLSIDAHVIICEKHDAELKTALTEIKGTLKEQNDSSADFREEVRDSLGILRTDVAILKTDEPKTRARRKQ